MRCGNIAAFIRYIIYNNNLARQSYLFYFCYLIAVEIVANTVICQKSDFITSVFNTLNFTQ